MKFLISIFLISTLFMSPTLSAATVSGEISNTPKIQYQKDTRGTCYTLTKNKKTGKMIKRLVAKKYCMKK